MDSLPRPRQILRLICLLPLAATGCRLLPTAEPVWKPQSPQQMRQEPPPANRPPLQLDGQGAPTATDFREKVSPDQEINVHLALGRTEEERGNSEAAIAAYQKALDACGKHAGLRPGAQHLEQKVLTHRRLGGAFDHLGKFAQAEEHHRAAAQLAPDDPKVWNDLGYSDYLQGHWEAAEQSLSRALLLAPNDPRIQTNLGLALAAAGKNDAALESLSKAGGSAVGHANLGYLLAALGKQDEARDHYRKALELQPKLAVAHQALAKLDGNVPTRTGAPVLSDGATTQPARLIPTRTGAPVLSDGATTQPARVAASPATDPDVRQVSVLPPDHPSQGIPWEK